MKRIIGAFLSLNILFVNSTFASAIEDDFANSTLDKSLKIQKVKASLIEDDFVNSTLDKNLKITKEKQIEIKDFLAENTLDKNLKIKKENKKLFADNLVLNLNGGKSDVKEVAFQLDKIKLYPKQFYTTKTGLYEGDKIEFILAQDVKIDKKVFKKGDIVKARVEMVSKNGAYGVPADLVVGNFVLSDNSILNGQLVKQGANRALWVYPTGYILSSFFLIGLPIFAIRGGHVKLKPNKVYEIEI